MTTSSNPQPSIRLNWRLLIPFLMMLAAVLACDSTYTAPPQVTLVEAEAEQPGHAYAAVSGVAYETTDYGQHWQPSEHPFSGATPKSYVMDMRGETLYLGDKAIWSFPRPIFRFFFLAEDFEAPRFLLPFGTVSNSAQGDTVYVAMGTQGVLVGRITAEGTLADWEIRANGLDKLNPQPLTLQDTWEIISVVAFALLVPPSFLLHFFLLFCLWVYVLPREEAKCYAIFATLGLMLAAAVGVAYWVTSLQTDYLQVVGMVTGLSIILNVGLTLNFASKQADAPRTRWLVLGAVVVSLIVPAGIATIFVGWWAVYLLVFGFAVFRRAYKKLFEGGLQTWQERWLADRLALETALTSAIMTAVILGVLWVVGSRLVPYGSISLLQIGILLVLIGGITVLTRRYVAWRLERLEKPKRDVGGIQLQFKAVNAIIQTQTLVWMVATVFASVVTLVGQIIAYGWFTSLTK